ncbi:MAG: LCP family protein [Clostridia bacterium]|nr:LCP family protein [Clostridia bacterium]
MKDIYISGNHNEEPEEIDVFSVSPEPEEPKKPKKPKNKHRLRRFICIVLIILLLPALPVMAAAAVSGYTRNDLKRNEYVSFGDVAKNPLVSNILLLGVDGEEGQSSRSDSMILVSIDFVHQKIKLTSFLRDCWVEIPSKGKNAKLNAAYAYGGPQLAKDTIEYNYGVGIDHFIKVDFRMFKMIIDKLGGVDVEVTKKEADFINKTTRQTVESGSSVHLNGEEALVYCRIRKLDTDYMRTFRQRKVITALLNKAKKASAADLIAMAKEVFPLIETDLSPSEISILAYKGTAALLGFDLVQTRVPTDDQMRTDTVSGQWVEIADMDAVREYLYDFIYTGKKIKEE